MIQAELRPRGPYSLRLSARRAGDATRTVRDGVLTCVLDVGGGPETASAWQRPDGTTVLRAETSEAIDRLRFVLAVDDDHTPFLRRFGRDPLIGEATLRMRGLRPLRLPTVAQALLRALCGQLIQSRRAREIERTVIRATTPQAGWLHAPPSTSSLAEHSPARLRALGLHGRRGATLVRICRSLELERLREVPTEAVADRLRRERGLGPWSVGVVCLEGLGRADRGLVGDLGLIKLCAALRGRAAEAWETEELLEPTVSGPASPASTCSRRSGRA